MTKKAPTAEPTDAERFRDRMVLPEPTNLLKLAEQSYAKLRADQRSAKERIGPAYSELAEHSTPAIKELIAELEENVRALDAPLQVARRERDDRREQFSQKAREALGPAIAEYADTINRRLNELEDLLRCGLDLHTSAVISGVSLQRMVENSQSLAAGIHAMRRAMRGGY